MRGLFVLAAVLLLMYNAIGQVKIHAHNDYEKSHPLTNALANQAYSIEADVFLQDGKLLVAHSKKEVSTVKTLDGLYIKPIIALFKKNKSKVSRDSSYRFSLMIDVKEGGGDAIRQLVKSIKPYQRYFDRQLNRNAVQIVISGDRGSSREWKKYPRYIFFDGRPNENYDDATLKKVAVISDSYAPYAENKDKLKLVVEQAHQLGKPFRFWGTPDNEFSWNYFNEAGIDIINTDKPESCRNFFESRKVDTNL
jgi:alkaline phosphatase